MWPVFKRNPLAGSRDQGIKGSRDRGIEGSRDRGRDGGTKGRRDGGIYPSPKGERAGPTGGAEIGRVGHLENEDHSAAGCPPIRRHARWPLHLDPPFPRSVASTVAVVADALPPLERPRYSPLLIRYSLFDIRHSPPVAPLVAPG